MRHLGVIFLLLPLFGLLVDYYIYRVVRQRVAIKYRHRYILAHCLLSVLLFVDAVVLVCLPVRGGSDTMLCAAMWMMFVYLSALVPKLLFTFVDLLAKLPGLWHHRRMRWLSAAGVIMAVLLFVAMWWGAAINRYRIDVTEVSVGSPEVPAAFDGYRILQFSDFHVGTYGTDTAYVSKVVDRINSLHPDLIVFTGDIVNRHSAELRPFVPVLRRLSARDGVMAILGNHDYGDYCSWPDEAAKAASLCELKQMLADAGINLLCDRAEHIVHAGDTLSVVGVNNISEPQFQTYGSLDRAYPADSPHTAKILLTHNPEHWRRDISGRPFETGSDFFLTLSGHTHAMQVELAGLSPSALIYPLWGGLYNDGCGRFLYVNIGLGTVGYPMRLGATPELTLITLESVKQQKI